MKRRFFISVVFVVLTCMSQTAFSQNATVRRTVLSDTEQFDIALNSKNVENALKTHLKIPEDYELRNRGMTE